MATWERETVPSFTTDSDVVELMRDTDADELESPCADDADVYRIVAQRGWDARATP